MGTTAPNIQIFIKIAEFRRIFVPKCRRADEAKIWNIFFLHVPCISPPLPAHFLFFLPLFCSQLLSFLIPSSPSSLLFLSSLLSFPPPTFPSLSFPPFSSLPTCPSPFVFYPFPPLPCRPLPSLPIPLHCPPIPFHTPLLLLPSCPIPFHSLPLPPPSISWGEVSTIYHAVGTAAGRRCLDVPAVFIFSYSLAAYFASVVRN